MDDIKKNSIKGYITSFLGILIILTDAFYFLGLNTLVNVPDCAPLKEVFNASVLFLIGLALFVIPETTLEQKINSFTDYLYKKFFT
jgi:hypothetical protein